MSPDLHQLFDDAGRTPPRAPWDADDVVRRGHTRRRRRRATTVTASVAATALVVAAAAFLASPGTGRGAPPAASSEPPATAAASTPTPGPPAPSASATRAQVACRADDVDLSLGTLGNAAGTSYRAVVASPLDGRSCALDGYPAVTLADAAGTVVGSPATHSQVAAVHPVLVGPSRASFLLGLADTGNFAAAACSPVPVATLRVALPGEPTAIALPLPPGTLTCSRDVSALGEPLVAGPWVSGSTGH